jgi:hypothetical protein
MFHRCRNQTIPDVHYACTHSCLCTKYRKPSISKSHCVHSISQCDCMRSGVHLPNHDPYTAAKNRVRTRFRKRGRTCQNKNHACSCSRAIWNRLEGREYHRKARVGVPWRMYDCPRGSAWRAIADPRSPAPLSSWRRRRNLALIPSPFPFQSSFSSSPR